MPLLRGRIFSDHDLEDTPQVAVINQARGFAPTGQIRGPLGKRVRLRLDSREPLSSAKPAWTTIVGVIADARTEILGRTRARSADLPQRLPALRQESGPSCFADNSIPAPSLRKCGEQIQSIDPELPVFHAQTLQELLSDSLSVRRFSMEMVALFAATALLLAGPRKSTELFSYVVNEQRREIAIRPCTWSPKRRHPTDGSAPRDSVWPPPAQVWGLVGALIVSHLMAGPAVRRVAY